MTALDAPIRLDDHTEIHVARRQGKNGPEIDIRIYSKTGALFFPTPKGLACPLEHLEELIQQLRSQAA